MFAPSASALDDVNTKQLRNAVTVNGILGHERAAADRQCQRVAALKKSKKVKTRQKGPQALR